MVKNIHPLNMLSASEICDAVSILKKSNKDHESSSYSYITLEEPEKKLLKENTNLDRIVKIVGVSHKSKGFEATISLSKKEVIKEEEPLFIQAAREDDKELFLKIFWSVGWTKCEALGQI